MAQYQCVLIRKASELEFGNKQYSNSSSMVSDLGHPTLYFKIIIKGYHTSSTIYFVSANNWWLVTIINIRMQQ